MSFVSEFKEFAMKGNMVDMAVGIIIGAAFGKIVSSLVGDIVMPPIGMAIGGVNFSDLAVTVGTNPGTGASVVLRSPQPRASSTNSSRSTSVSGLPNWCSNSARLD